MSVALIVPVAASLNLTMISIVVSVGSNELLCCNSYEDRILQLCCSLKVAMTLPRDWSSANPAGAALTALGALGLTLLTASIGQNESWQLGL